MKKELLKQLRSDYEKLEIKPSADLWSILEQMDLEIEKSPAMSPKKAFRWWKYAAVLILLFSVGVLLYFNENHPVNTIHSTAHTKPAKKNIEKLFSQNPDIHVAENIKTENNTSQKRVEENVSLPQAYQQEEIVQKERFSSKEEQIIVSDYEIKAPVLDRNIDLLPGKASLAEKKKTEYINADELLQGREFQKKREENKTDIRKFGTLDMTKIKVKSPNSLKVFGVTVFSDSLESK
ncbi:hypothetical protein DBR39_07315 [Chryseobacterium sp. KBW03]|uniref:hypothetical protein n=1 Tax=Chryseobacterium sp. KBW03 TaxID=2153362 RepID=UPI000F5B334F|nr:hypothetical protein [Chryseobacterium sp. KBW03]RQO40738.1 hypothetical protein DBR39_07315 [Chryseobacterium sp. KBW03]